MSFSLEEIRNCLNEFPRFRYEETKNFFDIGIRGFYENPFTEVLSYILNQKSEFSRSSEFLELMLDEILNTDEINSIKAYRKISTQHTIFNGNFIDLIIYNNNHIVVFENKIFHHLNNPFDDYENDIAMKFPSLDKHFVVLSYKKENVFGNWKYLNLQKAFTKILNTLEFKENDKWDYFVKDFLLHFSDKIRLRMEENIIEFFENNFSKIMEAQNRLNAFVSGVAEQIKDENTGLSYRIANNWGDNEMAIRFYPLSNENNVTLIFSKTGSFNVSVYYYDDFRTNGNTIHNHIGVSKYLMWNEGNIACFSLIETLYFSKLENALKEVNNQLELQRIYFSQKQSLGLL